MYRRCLLVALLLLVAATKTWAQATISTTASVIDVPRSGVNISPETYYAEQVAANIFQNPGFEYEQYGQAIGVTGLQGSTAFYGNNTTSDPSNSWNDATCSVRVGTCSDGSNDYCWNNSGSPTTGGCAAGTCNAGTTFTVASYSGSGPGGSFNCGGSQSYTQGQTITCTGGCPTLAAPTAIGSNGLCRVDVVGCRVAVPTLYSWSGVNSNIFLTNTKSHSGNSSLEINATNGNQSISQQWDDAGSSFFNPNTCVNHPTDICTQNSDCPSGDTCATVSQAIQHPVVGNLWQFSFYALTSSSGASCSATLGRNGQAANFSNHSFPLISDGVWHQYTLPFTGQDTSSTPTNQPLNFSMSCSGGTVFLDDMFLGKTNGVSEFKEEVSEVLQNINVGSIREMDGGTISGNALTEAQAVGNKFTMPPAGETISTGVEQGALMTFGDTVGLAASVGTSTSPWLTIPMAWTDADYTAFGNQLCSWETTYNFPSIWVECNNEDWNGANNWWQKLHGILVPGYRASCARAFNLISTACPDSQIRYLLNNQTGNAGADPIEYGIGTGTTGLAYGFPNNSQYGFSEHMYAVGTITSGSSIGTAIQDFFGGITKLLTGALNGGTNSDVGAVCDQSPPCNRLLGNYEWDVQSDGNAGNPKLLGSQVGAGWGGAGVAMQTFLTAVSAAPAAQAISTNNHWQLAQTENSGYLEFGVLASYGGTDKDFAPVWPWLRPSSLGAKLYNTAVGSGQNYYACTGAPPGITCAAFCSPGQSNCNLALANSNTSSTSVSVAFPPGTTAPPLGYTVLYSSGMTDNNENSNSVTIGELPGGVTVTAQTANFTAPPLSAVVLLESTPVPTPTLTPTATPTSAPTATIPAPSPTLTATSTSQPTPTATPTSAPTATVPAPSPSVPRRTPTPLPSTAPQSPTPTPRPPPSAIPTPTLTPSVSAVVQLSRGTLPFGEVKVGKSRFKSVVLTNTAKKKSGATVTFNGASISGSSDFSFSTSCNGPIAPKTRCSVTIRFAPTSVGAVSAVVTIRDNASNNPQSIAVSGAGK